MAQGQGYAGAEHDAAFSRQHDAPPHEQTAASVVQPSLPEGLLSDPRLTGRGNAAVRQAVLQQMQQTHGNRALQRSLQGSPPLGGPAVQRAPPTGTTTRKPVLEMTPDEFKADTAAQDELFNLAVSVRGRQNPFAQALMSGNGVIGEAESILKRDDKPSFVQGVYEKCKRNGYARIGEMTDMVRGRFDLASEHDVQVIAAALQRQNQFPFAEIVGPRRPQPEGGHGYPRWHIIVIDHGIKHEWQIGTAALTEVYETEGIKLPPGVNLPKGMKTDLHDIEYDIFQAIKKKAAKGDKECDEVYKKHKLADFSSQVDKLSAEAGRQGDQTPDLQKKIKALHIECSQILHAIVAEKGAKWLDQFYKQPGPEETSEGGDANG